MSEEPEPEPEVEIDFEKIDLYSVELKVARNATKIVASRRLVKGKVSVYHSELRASITFTNKGIDECINQPFDSYIEKLSLIRDGLEEALSTSKYDYRPEPPDESKGKKKDHIAYYHYLETTINNKPAFFNIQQTKKGEYVLYTITDRHRSASK